MSELEALQQLNNLADLVYFKKKNENSDNIWELILLNDFSTDSAVLQRYYTIADSYDVAMLRFENYVKFPYEVRQVKKIKIPIIPKVL